MDIKELIGKAVVCEKVDAINYKEGHPNDINTGYTTGGILKALDPCIIINTGYALFWSSEVDHIENDLVYTRNSVYKISELDIRALDTNK